MEEASDAAVGRVKLARTFGKGAGWVQWWTVGDPGAYANGAAGE
eukprot:CAMPEP_0119298706 /NCGR_PEP_ID=MMETSP1333-20130426/873_1 /TAXON_ID=418940 /ORGANISM="Scyphosphaera apsteinii, Strain RCC1455" /LENGTH=43 /DNA_ID= /DNA_START= /DNA_END= /DNA_ORIENTATION=